MAVVSQEQMGGDGHAESIEAFIESHESNTKTLLNLAEGKKGKAPRPVYDPSHPDNHWPYMVHHAAKGELTIGTTLKGTTNNGQRAEIAKANKAALEAAYKLGYRDEPWPKPQVTVLDPAAEKAALIEQNKQLQGQIVMQGDAIAKLTEMVEALMSKKG